MIGTLIRKVGRALCALGGHNEQPEASWTAPGLNTIHAVTCAWCGRSRCHIAGAEPIQPPAPNTRLMGLYKVQHQQARRWLEAQRGVAITGRFVERQ